MDRRRYEVMLQAEQPIAHHSETFGNTALIMRRRMRTRGGWADVPVITADTMRHGMREAAAYALLDAAGLLGAEKLSEAALRLLFAGGMVTGRGEASVVKLDQYRELCELVPSMTLFGGCADNRVIPGQLIVEDAVLVCEETAPTGENGHTWHGAVPPWASAHASDLCGELDVARSHVEEAQRVRMDPTLSPEKTKLLEASSQVEVNKRLAASEAAAEAGDAIAVEREKSSMMPRTFERVAQGSLFYWACEARIYSDLELDTFHVALGAFLANCWVGGKRGTGHGKLRPVHAKHIELAAVARASEAVDTTALAGRAGDLFRSHVAERSDRIASFLATVNA